MFKLKILFKKINIHPNTSSYQSSTGFPIIFHAGNSKETLCIPFTNFYKNRQRNEFPKDPQDDHRWTRFWDLPRTVALQRQLCSSEVSITRGWSCSAGKCTTQQTYRSGTQAEDPKLWGTKFYSVRKTLLCKVTNSKTFRSFSDNY